MSDGTYLESQERPVARRTWLRSPWLVVLMAGWLTYEVTARPALAVAVCCLKFGWEELKTALWLRGADIHRGRGWACGFLYLAFGLWRVTCIACGLGLAMIPLFEVLKNRGGAQVGQIMQDLEQQAISLAIVTFAGFSLASLTTFIAVMLAAWSGCKLWVDGQVHWDRRENRWPPSNQGWERKNKAGLLLLASLIPWVTALILTATVGLALAGGEKLKDITLAIMMSILIGMSIGLLIARDYLSRRILAQSPSECWSLEPIGRPREYRSG